MEWVLFATGWLFMTGFALKAGWSKEIPLKLQNPAWFDVLMTLILAPFVFGAAIWETLND